MRPVPASGTVVTDVAVAPPPPSAAAAEAASQQQQQQRRNSPPNTMNNNWNTMFEAEEAAVGVTAARITPSPPPPPLLLTRRYSSASPTTASAAAAPAAAAAAVRPRRSLLLSSSSDDEDDDEESRRHWRASTNTPTRTGFAAVLQRTTATASTARSSSSSNSSSPPELCASHRTQALATSCSEVEPPPPPIRNESLVLKSPPTATDSTTVRVSSQEVSAAASAAAVYSLPLSPRTSPQNSTATTNVRRRHRTRSGTTVTKKNSVAFVDNSLRKRRMVDVDAFIEEDEEEDEEDEACDTRETTTPVPTPATALLPPDALLLPPALARSASQTAAVNAVIGTEKMDASHRNSPLPPPPHDLLLSTAKKSNYDVDDAAAVTGSLRDERIPRQDALQQQQEQQPDLLRRSQRKERLDRAIAALTEDELAAVVAPDLRRASSTPGAFHAGGNSSGSVGGLRSSASVVVTSTTTTASAFPALTEQDQIHEEDEYHVPLELMSPPWISTGSSVISGLSYTNHGGGMFVGGCVGGGEAASIVDSCTTLVSATLVTSATRGCSYSDDCSDDGNGGGVAGEADADVDTRVECQSGEYSSNCTYPVLAHAEPIDRKRRIVVCFVVWVVATVVMVTVSVSLALTYTGVIGNWKPVDVVNSEPSSAPVTVTNTPPVSDDSSVQISNHAVAWGKISTCDDSNFFVDYDLELRCGGRLDLIHVENADCKAVDDTDVTRMQCQLSAPDEPLATGEFQEATAMAIFSCRGLFNQDRASTVSLPDMKVRNCPQRPDGRRRLSQNSKLRVPPESARERAVQDAVATGGASAFVSLGIFCQPENSTDWSLYHEFVPCESGSRVTVNGTQAEWNGDLPDTADVLEDPSTWSTYNAQNFCYSLKPCQADPGAECATNNTNSACIDGICSYDLEAIRMSNSELHSSCKSQAHDNPSSNFMQEVAQKEFSPSDFLDQVSGPFMLKGL